MPGTLVIIALTFILAAAAAHLAPSLAFLTLGLYSAAFLTIPP